MTDGCAAWVKARITLTRAYTGKVRQADADGGKSFIIQAGGNLHRLKPLRVLELAVNTVNIIGGKRQQFRQRADCFIFSHQPIGNDVDPKVGAVGGNWSAISVHEPAPARGNDSQINAVAFGQ